MTDDTPDTFIALLIDAWREALTTGGIYGTYLTAFIGALTLAFAPALPVIIALEKIGVFDVNEGFKLP